MKLIMAFGILLMMFLSTAKGSTDTCSYTFIVPSDSATDVWPTTVTESRMNNLENTVANQQSLINYQQSQMQLLSDRIAALENLPSYNVEGNGDVGTTYVRWGRTVCPNVTNTDIVYKGYAGKSHYAYGGGVNYQCLPGPELGVEWPTGATGGHQSKAYMYGVEYEPNSSPLISTAAKNHDAPCAVCNVNRRSRMLMIPARKTCPDGWTEEYSGLLVSAHHSHKGSTFECLDSEFEYDTAGYQNQDGGLFYVVEAVCGSLPCTPYINGYELACVVCTM